VATNELVVLRKPRSDLRRLAGIGVAVVLMYFATAQLGFRFAFAAEQVTTVWIPTGLAQAALLLWGRRLWPAVWLGAFAANASTTAPIWTAAFIASGNTLEAVTAAWILSRFLGFDPSFRRIRDGLAFVVVAAGVSTAISATVGVGTLLLAGLEPSARFSELWWAWWVGDGLGSLVVGPAILTIARPPIPRTRAYWIETAAIVAGTALVTQFVYSRVPGAANWHNPLEYTLVPFVIGAAVRLGLPATALVVLVASGVSISDTLQGVGPFASEEVHESLIALQVFTGVLAGTGLLLAAAIVERKTGERRRAAAHAVGEVLAGAATLEEAAPLVIQAVCKNLGWPLGALWVVEGDAIRCLSVWSEPIRAFDEFARVTKEFRFASGIGLPGRVWSSGTATWVDNVVDDPNFPRRPIARAAGLRGAFAFPIRLGPEVHGVIEFFNRSIAAPDQDLLRTMSTVGNQIGQFVARKRVEAAVHDGQRRTRAILNTALDAIIGMDDQGRITEFNPAAERAFGYTHAEAVGRDLVELLVPTELHAQYRAAIRQHLASGRRTSVNRRIDTSARHADGHEFPVEVSIIRIVDGTSTMFTGFVRDLTDRVRTEREREQLLQRELTARREAEAANRAKDEFLATLSHELRTPLNAIVGWTRMLLDGTVDEQSARRALEVIDRNAHLQAQLVEDILDVSRIITGGLRLERKPVDLGSIIGAAYDAVRPAAEAKRIRLQSRLDGAARLTEGDPQRLQQVVWNLLANAVKFTPPGGMVDIDLVEGGERAVQIIVRDNGAGIDPKFLPHVFERFRQADGSVSRQHGGLGLGLAIVRHLVELHGGTVGAESNGLGTGSTFVIELPRLDPEAGSVLAGSQRESQPLQRPSSVQTQLLAGCRALVVDDDEDARALLATILVQAGAAVQTAASVPEALHLLDSSPMDVLLADIGMPGEDGYALIQEVRRRDAPIGTRLPAAAITAYAGAHSRERALAAGFDSHVAKPIVPADVVRMVLSLCNETGRPS
jgi:PAS domain S-box-containing protein